MEGSKRLRQKVLSVVRSFLPNRLAEEVEAAAYERLLAGDFRNRRRPLADSDVDATASDVTQEFGEEAEEFVTTGGRS